MDKSTTRHSTADMISHHDIPRGTQNQRSHVVRQLERPTLEQAHPFSGKDQATKVSASATPDVTTATTYKHAYAWANPRWCTGAESRSARTIITEVRCNKTARGYTSTEVSSKSVHHNPVEAYSNTYTL